MSRARDLLLTASTARDFMNGMSGAKMRSYTGAFKLMHLLENQGPRAGRKYRPGLQSNPLVLPCSMALSSSEEKLGLISSCCAHSDWNFIECTTLSATYTPAIVVFFVLFFKKMVKFWGYDLHFGMTYTPANTSFIS